MLPGWLPVGAVRELDAAEVSVPSQVGLVQFTDSGTGTHANYRLGVDSTLTVESRLTAVPPKPSNIEAVNADHWSVVNVNTGPVGSLESRTARVLWLGAATSIQFPDVPL